MVTACHWPREAPGTGVLQEAQLRQRHHDHQGAARAQVLPPSQPPQRAAGEGGGLGGATPGLRVSLDSPESRDPQTEVRDTFPSKPGGLLTG